MTEIIMWILAACALLGGLDRLAGNRFGPVSYTHLDVYKRQPRNAATFAIVE